MLSYGRQSINEADIAAVVECLRGDFLTTGPFVDRFEEQIAMTSGANFAVACSNGTTALHLACLAAGIGPGSVVVVPTLTFLATANAVRMCGGEVIFCDVDPETGLMSEHGLRDALKRASAKDQKVQAIMPVYLKGQLPDTERLRLIAKDHNPILIADGAHAFGSIYKGEKVGAAKFADLTTFSFHPVKNICTGEGGAIVTNNEEMASRMRLLRSHHAERNDPNEFWHYSAEDIGYNYRLTDIQAALGIAQIKRLHQFKSKRTELLHTYNEYFDGFSAILKCPKVLDGNDSAWHLYSVAIDFNATTISRAELITQLRECGIGTQIHYIPVHSQPYYTNRYGELSLPGAGKYYSKTLSLPLHFNISAEDVEYICKKILKLVGLPQ